MNKTDIDYLIASARTRAGSMIHEVDNLACALTLSCGNGSAGNTAVRCLEYVANRRKAITRSELEQIKRSTYEVLRKI